MVNLKSKLEQHTRPTKRVKKEPAPSQKRTKGSPRPSSKTKISSSKASLGAVDVDSPRTVTKPPKDKGKAKTSDLPSSFNIIAGSYEKLLYGLHATVSTSSDAPEGYDFNLKPIFIFPAHVSCIKAVAASPSGGKWLATGSADEIVKVWDLRRRKEIGGLMHHEGSITHLEFPSRSHLFSASEDGTLCLFRARDWAVLRSLKGHKGRVNCVAVHPSGKVALSVGKDRTLRMWDLMRGKGSGSTKLGKEGEIVRWSKTGSMFIVQAQSIIDVYTTDMRLVHTIRHSSRVQDVKFAVHNGSDILLIGAEDKKVSVYSISPEANAPPTVFAEMTGHQNRIKAIDLITIALPATSSRKTTTLVCTTSSDGMIHVYDLAGLGSEQTSAMQELDPVARYDSKGTRFTCLTVADVESNENNILSKRKREDEGDEGDEGDEDVDEDDDDGDSVQYVSEQEEETEEEQDEDEDEDSS